MPQTVALSTGTIVEIISAYATLTQTIDAVASAPAWMVVGSFFMPKPALCKLELVGLVSDPANSMTARLFNSTDSAVVSGSTTDAVVETTDARKFSGVVSLDGGKLYQMQVQVIGPDNTTFGVARSVQLVNP